MIEQILHVVTPTTVAGTALAGVILGLLFIPIFGRTIGADPKRVVWAASVGIGVVGAAFLCSMAVSRYLDGSDAWLAWLGTMILWAIMTASVAITTRITGG